MNFSYLLGAALGNSNGILIGRLCGEGDFELADKITYQSLRTVIFINLVISVTVALFGGLLLKGLFDASDEIISVARLVFWVDVLVELGRAPGHVGEGVMRSTGQVLFMAIVSMLSCWIIGVGGAFVLGVALGLGLMGMWIALAIDENIRGICFITKYKKGNWKKSFVKKIF
jgi:Na+-driven multidrug efflux pump